MPVWLVPVIWGVVNVILTSLISRIITALGVGSIAFIGSNVILGRFRSSVLAMLSGLPADAVSILGMSGMGVCFSIVISAFSIRLVLNGVDSADKFVTTKLTSMGGGK